MAGCIVELYDHGEAGSLAIRYEHVLPTPDLATAMVAALRMLADGLEDLVVENETAAG